MKEGAIILIIFLIIVCLCCLCVLVLGGFSYLLIETIPTSISFGTPINLPGQTPTPIVVRPTQRVEPIPTPTTPILRPATPQVTVPPNYPTPVPLPTRDQPPIPTPKPIVWPVPTDTLNTLQQAIVPINDLRDLAFRLEGKEGIPETLPPPPAPYQVGAQQTFWVTNIDTNENFQIQATLQYVTFHTYFWVEDGVRFNRDELATLAQTFENEIYPTTREFFGSEWSPGVDGDPHIYILYASGLGWDLAGYYSSADEYHPLAHEYSNGHEMFLFNADNVDLDDPFTYGVLAHEFQHMIHWYQDRNETSWLNEGFSELAAFLNGYYEGGFDWAYAQNPDLQLTDWPNSEDTTPNYGASFLFVAYFLDRFGEQATKALVAHPNNGMSSVDEVLADLNLTDPLTGRAITADDVFLDWALANYLQNSHIGDGRYNYTLYTGVPDFNPTDTFYSCPVNMVTRDVRQYGVDYISLKCRSGDYTLRFEGSVQVNVLPVDPYSGNYYFWSNKGDESDMTLTRTFDFTNASAPLSLTYHTWYDLEEDYDYVYLVASTDGHTWQILTTPSGTAEDPSGNSFGWGYNGLSGGGRTAQWIEETVDLSQFAGQVVQLRFEYVTDAAVNGEGMVLDDIAIPQIGYFTDFEQDTGGWEAQGWVRIQNILPQTYRLALIKLGANPTVEYITLNEDITAEVPLQFTSDVNQIVLVVAGTTRFTRMPAAYRFEVQP